ncbi:MAG: hypothetical protein K2G37_02020, partial [Clostridia bacterium]|nr:hypothetical protein [Clostridia bacterium]
MNFTKRQKLSLILSIWLFFLWIVVVSLVMRVDFKGNLVDCIVFSLIGMAIAVALYLLVFVDKYAISKTLKEDEDVKRIKSMKRTAYIRLIYIDIIGFFLMTLTSLLIDGSKHRVSPALYFAVATFALLCVSFIKRYKKI